MLAEIPSMLAISGPCLFFLFLSVEGEIM